MQVIVTGLNYETASVEIRERVAIAPEQLPQALAALRAIPGVREAAILSTCNRTEVLVAAGPELPPGSLGHFLPAFHQLPPGLVSENRIYTHRGLSAAAHLCAVAAGLKSAIVGETQILAQVKEAYRIASAQASLGPYLHQLFNLAIATAKQVHTETPIGLNPVSVGSVAVNAIRGVLPRLKTVQALILGTGKVGRLALRHVAAAGVGSILVSSRSAARARSAAAGTGARCVGPDEFPGALEGTDVLITATSGLAVRTEDVRAACGGRRAPLLIIDLGVPRNVEASVTDLPRVKLLNIDDLKQVVEVNLNGRRRTAQTALQMVNQAAERYGDWMESRAVAPLISSLNAEADRIRREELNRVRARIGPEGAMNWLIVEELTRSLTGRLLHECTVTLKRSTTGRDARDRRWSAPPERRSSQT